MTYPCRLERKASGARVEGYGTHNYGRGKENNSEDSRTKAADVVYYLSTLVVVWEP
jgi:hypothetical protein